MPMKRLLAACVYVFLMVSAAYGDSWILKPEVTDNEFTFGDTRIVLHYDSTQSRNYPQYTLRIHEKDKLAAEHDGIGFEKLFVSPDKGFFLGVSNRGLIKDAYVVFDRQGKILKKQPHDPKKVHYKSMSVTLLRLWYDADNPDVKFDVVDGVLRDVTINAADGKRVSLLDKAAEKP
jgi:hypothetical protein